MRSACTLATLLLLGFAPAAVHPQPAECYSSSADERLPSGQIEVVQFERSWCEGCSSAASVLEETKRRYGGRLFITSVAQRDVLGQCPAPPWADKVYCCCTSTDECERYRDQRGPAGKLLASRTWSDYRDGEDLREKLDPLLERSGKPKSHRCLDPVARVLVPWVLASCAML